MKAIVAYTYIATIAIIWVFLWVRHFYLIHLMNTYMLAYHEAEWNKMKKNLTGWYRMPSLTPYYTKAIYDYIWRSDENYGDQNITLQKGRIRRVVWELPLYFFAVLVLTVFLLWTGVLK